jgi:hypothetical protein
MEIRFEARELPTYAQPISIDELTEGTVYFFVNFADDEMLIPTIETVVYIGENLESDDVGQVYFQDLDSFNRGVQYGTEDDGECAVFQRGSGNELGHVFTFEQALNELMKCSLRRKRKSM